MGRGQCRTSGIDSSVTSKRVTRMSGSSFSAFASFSYVGAKWRQCGHLRQPGSSGAQRGVRRAVLVRSCDQADAALSRLCNFSFLGQDMNRTLRAVA